MTDRIQMRITDPGAMAWLDDRAARMGDTVPLQARTEIAMMRMILDAELSRIRLTLPQALAIAGVLNSRDIHAHVAAGLGLVYAQCDEAFRLARRPPSGAASSYGVKHGFTEQELLDYLATLGPAADHALADAISRWWDQDLDGTGKGFAMAGIAVTCP